MDGTHHRSLERVIDRRGILQLLPYGALALGLGAPVGQAVAGDGCTVTTGTQHDILTAEACTSPIGFCAEGTFKGNHGYQGTTSFSALAFDPIPSDPLGRLAVPARRPTRRRTAPSR